MGCSCYNHKVLHPDLLEISAHTRSTIKWCDLSFHRWGFWWTDQIVIIVTIVTPQERNIHGHSVHGDIDIVEKDCSVCIVFHYHVQVGVGLLC